MSSVQFLNTVKRRFLSKLLASFGFVPAFLDAVMPSLELTAFKGVCVCVFTYGWVRMYALGVTHKAFGLKIRYVATSRATRDMGGQQDSRPSRHPDKARENI